MPCCCWKAELSLWFPAKAGVSGGIKSQGLPAIFFFRTAGVVKSFIFAETNCNSVSYLGTTHRHP
jgi:hypothetical protein